MGVVGWCGGEEEFSWRREVGVVGWCGGEEEFSWRSEAIGRAVVSCGGEEK